MQNSATLAFHAAASRIVRNKPKGLTTASRRLHHCKNELASAKLMGLTDKQTLACFRQIEGNPLAGLKDSTALVYISQARSEMGYRKYRKAK